MGPTILVAGAGFSKPWGHPVTTELFPLVKRLLPQLGADAVQMIGPVLQAVERSGVFGRPLDLEHFMTALREAYTEDEMDWEKTYGIRKDGGLWDPELIYRSLVQLLGLVLSETDPAKDQRFRKRLRSDGPPEPYSSFLQEHGPFDGVVTTNYDVVCESLFPSAPDYGVGDVLPITDVRDAFFDMKENLDINMAKVPELRRTVTPEHLEMIRMQPIKHVSAARVAPGNFPLMKIHGGVNLVYCPSCQGTLVSPEVVRGDYVRFDWGWLGCTGFASSFHCGPVAHGTGPPNMNPNRLQSIAVVPVRNKDRLRETKWLLPAISRAHRIMKTAGRVVVVGSSVRESDAVLRTLLSASKGSRTEFIGDQGSFDRLRTMVRAAEQVGTRL